MNVDKFTWLVEERRLFMPLAAKLGDPREGSLPRGELDWWETKAINANSEKERKIIRENRQKLSKWARTFRDSFCYVSCWHINEFENAAMWKCYTTKEQAVAVSTTYAQLLRSLPSEKIYSGVVRYVDFSKATLPTRNLFEPLMHKDVEFSYEHEARAIHQFIPGTDTDTPNLFESETNPEFKVFAPQIDPEELIHEVVVHPNASDAFFDAQVEYCDKYGLPRPKRSRRHNEIKF